MLQDGYPWASAGPARTGRKKYPPEKEVEWGRGIGNPPQTSPITIFYKMSL